MKTQTRKFPTSALYLIIFISAFMILTASVEVLLKAKDIQFYDSYIKVLKNKGQISQGYMSYFLTYMIGMYFARIAVPIGLTFNALFAHKRHELTKTFIWGWTLFLSGALLFTVLTFELKVVFYYVFIVSFILLIVVVLLLNREFNEKNKRHDQKHNQKTFDIKHDSRHDSRFDTRFDTKYTDKKTFDKKSNDKKRK